jgi:hypothetical protein
LISEFPSIHDGSTVVDPNQIRHCIPSDEMGVPRTNYGVMDTMHQGKSRVFWTSDASFGLRYAARAG